MKFKKCVIDSPYLWQKEGVFYRGKVFIINEPPVYLPDHDTPCEPIAEVDGQYLYRINDCAIEGDCFVLDKNIVIIRVGCLWGLVDVMSGEILLEPLYLNKSDVEDKMMEIWKKRKKKRIKGGIIWNICLCDCNVATRISWSVWKQQKSFMV